jgi:hypothetical protein
LFISTLGNTKPYNFPYGSTIQVDLFPYGIFQIEQIASVEAFGINFTVFIDKLIIVNFLGEIVGGFFYFLEMLFEKFAAVKFLVAVDVVLLGGFVLVWGKEPLGLVQFFEIDLVDLFLEGKTILNQKLEFRF